MLECFVLQSCRLKIENWRKSSVEKVEVRKSSFKYFIQRGGKTVESFRVGVLQTYVEIGSKTIGMDDNESDDK